MVRIKSGIITHKKHKKILKLAKGYFGSKHLLFKTAKEQVMKSYFYSFRDRLKKKHYFRKIWIIRINAATKKLNLNYSKFIYGMKKKKIGINRQMLSYLSLNKIEDLNILIKKVKEIL